MARSANRDGELDIGPVQLAPGSHSSPREGICAVELASLLAGEKFSDHPRCVCRVIAAYMRSLNDRLAHADRQRLIPYAAHALGSRDDRETTHERRDLCLVWAGVPAGGGPLRSFLARLAMRARIWIVVGLRQAVRLNEGAGEYAARIVFARYGTQATFALLDHLLEAGEPLEPAPLADPVQGPSQARIAAAVRQLTGQAEAAKGENGGQAAHHNGHAGHLSGRDPGQGHEEGVEDDHAYDGDPEGETKPAHKPHDPARVP